MRTLRMGRSCREADGQRAIDAATCKGAFYRGELAFAVASPLETARAIAKSPSQKSSMTPIALTSRAHATSRGEQG